MVTNWIGRVDNGLVSLVYLIVPAAMCLITFAVIGIKNYADRDRKPQNKKNGFFRSKKEEPWMNKKEKDPWD